VIRRLTLLLSLAAVAVGIWLITRVGPLNAACNTSGSAHPGIGVDAKCTDIVASYFMGFALSIGGVTVLLLALIAMRRQPFKFWGKEPPPKAKLTDHEIRRMSRERDGE